MIEKIPKKYTHDEIKARLKKPNTINERMLKAFIISNYKDMEQLRKENITMRARLSMSEEYKRMSQIRSEQANHKNQYKKIMRLFILPENYFNGGK